MSTNGKTPKFRAAKLKGFTVSVAAGLFTPVVGGASVRYKDWFCSEPVSMADLKNM